MIAPLAEIVLGVLLMSNTFESKLYNLFNLNCGFEVSYAGCNVVSLFSIFFGLFMICDAILIMFNYWRYS